MTINKGIALAAIYGQISDLVEQVDEPHYSAPTGCQDFRVNELLFHMLLDAQRALVTLAVPGEAEPDTDDVSYWQKYVAALDGSDDMSHVNFVRRSAAAYARPSEVGAQWLAMAPAAVSLAGRTDPTATVRTQGHLIRVDDFLSKLVVEATIHFWDVSLDLLDELEAPEEAMSVTCDVLGRLVGVELPRAWDEEMLLVKTTGRHPLLDEEKRQLGHALERIPVIR